MPPVIGAACQERKVRLVRRLVGCLGIGFRVRGSGYAFSGQAVKFDGQEVLGRS
ncbi:hypothetical protein T484DRAFT_2258523 [Baffinella frigidus]|nr:hypothetical protein T484DRAFT_2258523 [Cryptophyta sp. CCMP2293]